jgi:hypothetical protein
MNKVDGSHYRGGPARPSALTAARVFYDIVDKATYFVTLMYPVSQLH